MPLRRSRLRVLAQISGAVPDGEAPWALRRADHERLARALPRLDRRRVVLVAGDGEATAAGAIALAAATAAAGRRSALVECDLERPALASRLGLRPQPGLHEYLRWEAQPAEIVQPLLLAGPAAKDAGAPLACVCAGRQAQSSKTLLGLGSFAHAVAKLRNAYESVVLLGPSLADDPAALAAVARQADAVVAGLAAEAANGRSGKSVRAAIRRLEVPALGAIAVT